MNWFNTGLPAYSDTGYNDTVRQWLLTVTLFQICDWSFILKVTMFGYSDTVRSISLTVTLFHCPCHCQRGAGSGLDLPTQNTHWQTFRPGPTSCQERYTKFVSSFWLNRHKFLYCLSGRGAWPQWANQNVACCVVVSSYLTFHTSHLQTLATWPKRYMECLRPCQHETKLLANYVKYGT